MKSLFLTAGLPSRSFIYLGVNLASGMATVREIEAGIRD